MALSGGAFGQGRPPAPSQPPVETDGTHKISATAFFVGQGGHLVTNAHVAGGCKDPQILKNGTVRPVRLLAIDPGRDLALLQAEAPVAGLDLGAGIVNGETVVAIGYPLSLPAGLDATVTLGIVTDSPELGPFIQTNARVQAGDSGGALVDSGGRAVGVVFGHTPTRTFAIAALRVQGFLAENGVRLPLVPKRPGPGSVAGVIAHVRPQIVRMMCAS